MDRQNELWKQKRQNRVKLDEPYHRGYNHSFVLRADISRRDDAWVFEAIIEELGRTTWTRKKKPSKSEKKRGGYATSQYRPSIRNISIEQYDRLIPAVQKWFSPHRYEWVTEDCGGYIENKFDAPTYAYKDKNGKYYSYFERGDKTNWKPDPLKGYRCTVPHFFFEVETTKHMVEYGYIVDELIEQELSEIDARLESAPFRKFRSWWGGAPKDFRKLINKGKTAHNKRVLRNLMLLDDPDDACRPSEEFLPYRSDAHWLWW